MLRNALKTTTTDTAKEKEVSGNAGLVPLAKNRRREVEEVPGRKTTTTPKATTTTTTTMFDSIRAHAGDVNLELRTTQTWGLGLSSGRHRTLGQSATMGSIKDAAEKLERDRKKARQELLSMTKKLEELEKTEKTLTKSLERERETTSKLQAHVHSANRKIYELKVKAAKVEEAHREIRDRLTCAEKAEKTCEDNLIFAQDALTDRLESDEKYLKTLNETIKERNGVLVSNEELVKRVEELTTSERQLFNKIEKKEEKMKEIFDEKEGAMAHLRMKADQEKEVLNRAMSAEKKARELEESFQAMLKVNVEKDEELLKLRKEKEKAETRCEGGMKKLSEELTKVKEKYEEDKLKWCETADVERLEVQTTKDALAKVSKALETETRQLDAANSTLREKEEQLFEFELERNKAKDALVGRENEMKRLEKEHKEKLDDLEEKYEREKREIQEEQNRTVEKTRKQLTEKNAEYISTKAAQNREEIERVKESAKKDIDRANANVIAKEEECEKLECEIVELKRDAKLRQTAYEAQLENLHKQSHVTSAKENDDDSSSDKHGEDDFKPKAPVLPQRSALKQRDQQKSTSKSTKSTKFTLGTDDDFHHASVDDKATVEKPPTSQNSRRRRVTIQTNDMDEGHANENDVETYAAERTTTVKKKTTATTPETRDKTSEPPTKSKPAAAADMATVAKGVSKGGVRKPTTRTSRKKQHVISVAQKKKTAIPAPASLSQQQRKTTLKAKKSPAKNALLRAKILQNARSSDNTSDEDGDDLEGLDPFAFADD